ncbi:hypothetical protein TAMA11512_06700 [Selenomonas sp. TAMA-11512]|uniref:SpoIVB peptidase S55 domain-containing protein n=1 Tax=Selenomonas sp. TAMA-11512 TaxID=3095337 RepID=UPI00309272AF|nr:hypothetical protein TAMA11512_06700 [Selenomonas sp. TAMA-11512]
MRNWKKKALALSVGITLLYQSAAYALSPTMAVEDVVPGMRGTAYTIIDNSGEIRPFNVEIVGTMDGGKGGEQRIMALASGSLIDVTGGALQGMSGSPVYIDGRLVGALSAGIKGMDPHTFLITPIADMLDIWTLPDRKNKTQLANSIDLRERIEEREKKGDEEKGIDETYESLEKAVKSIEEKYKKLFGASDTADEEILVEEKPADETSPAEESSAGGEASSDSVASDKEPKSAVYLSGFNSTGFSYMEREFKKMGIDALDTPVFGAPTGNVTTRYDANLFPGSSVGVAVVYGDFSVGATGTVTEVDGKRILGFGHPFLHKGNVNYFMTDASIVGTVHGVSDGMKIANVGQIIGRISQDREAGIAGTLGEFPSVVPIRVHVLDKTLERNGSYTAHIAYDEDFLPLLSAGIVYAAIGKVSDAVDEGTADIKFTIKTDMSKDGKLERSNMYYMPSDVGQTAVGELSALMNILSSNAEREADILGVDIDVKLENDRKTAYIVSAVPDQMSVKPGDTVTFKTTIKPYRREQEVLEIPYKVSENQRPGRLHLDVRGGGYMPPLSMLLQAVMTANPNAAVEEEERETTEEKIEKFLKMDKNNEIIIEPSIPVAMTEKEQKKMVKEAIKEHKRRMREEKNKKSEKQVDLLDANGMEKAEDMQEEGTKRYQAPYIIDNVIHATLKVEERK